jgi:hypothetical protein
MCYLNRTTLRAGYTASRLAQLVTVIAARFGLSPDLVAAGIQLAAVAILGRAT